MHTRSIAMTPSPEAIAAFEEVKALLDGMDLTAPENEAYALSLLRARNLPNFLIYGAHHQLNELSAETEAWAMQVIAEDRNDGVLP